MKLLLDLLKGFENEEEEPRTMTHDQLVRRSEGLLQIISSLLIAVDDLRVDLDKLYEAQAGLNEQNRYLTDILKKVLGSSATNSSASVASPQNDLGLKLFEHKKPGSDDKPN